MRSATVTSKMRSPKPPAVIAHHAAADIETTWAGTTLYLGPAPAHSSVIRAVEEPGGQTAPGTRTQHLGLHERLVLDAGPFSHLSPAFGVDLPFLANAVDQHLSVWDVYHERPSGQGESFRPEDVAESTQAGSGARNHPYGPDWFFRVSSEGQSRPRSLRSVRTSVAHSSFVP